jgi:hypothetical protein
VSGRSAANREDLFVGAAAAPADAAVVLYRGNLEPMIVPLTWFRTRPGGPKPDTADLAITEGPPPSDFDGITAKEIAPYRARRGEETPTHGPSRYWRSASAFPPWRCQHTRAEGGRVSPGPSAGSASRERAATAKS